MHLHHLCVSFHFTSNALKKSYDKKDLLSIKSKKSRYFRELQVIVISIVVEKNCLPQFHNTFFYANSCLKQNRKQIKIFFLLNNIISLVLLFWHIQHYSCSLLILVYSIYFLVVFKHCIFF